MMRVLPSLACLFLLTLSACEQSIDAGSRCGPSNCSGCCQADRCELGAQPGACGQGGLSCTVCSASQICSIGVCVGNSGGGGGGGGGMTGGGGGATGGGGGGALGGGSGGGTMGGGTGGGTGGGAPLRRVFTTSSTFDGNLAALGTGGVSDVLLIADGLCATLAQNAGVAGTFKAFLSTSSVAAIDRVAEAGPWRNMSGEVVFNSKTGFVLGPLASLAYDERGTLLPVDSSLMTWTGSTANGRYDSSIGSCADWTSNTNFQRATRGYPEAVDSTWVSDSPANCNAQQRLYCFEQAPTSCVPESDVAFCQRLQKTCGQVVGVDNCGSTRTAPSCGRCTSPQFCAASTHTCAVPPGKRVFVTSQTFTGDLLTAGGASSGVAGGDRLCANAAASNNLGGTWRAWLSDSFEDAIDHVTGTGPWHRLDGVVVFPNHASLTGAALAPIEIDEFGETITTISLPDQSVWTGSGQGGRRPQPGSYAGENTCVDFALTTQGGVIFGITGWVHGTSNWSNNDYSNCVTSNHLYCFET